MSGEYVAVGAASGSAGASIALATAGVFVVAAGACVAAGVASAHAVAIVGRGAIRLGKETYTSIDEQVKEHAAREMIRHQEKLRKHFVKVPGNTWTQLPPIVEAPPVIAQGNPLAELEKIIETRRTKEKKDNLPDKVSTEMAAELGKIEEMVKNLHTISTPSPIRPAAVGSEKEQLLRDEILTLIGPVSSFYPDEAFTAKKVVEDLGSQTRGLQEQLIILKEKETIIAKHAIPLIQLDNVKKLFESDGWICSSLPVKEKERFNKKFTNLRDQIGVRGTADINELEQLRATLSAQAMVLHDQKVFDESVSLFQKAMQEARYTVSRTSTQKEIILQGRTADGVKTRITLGTPAANSDGKVKIKMKVDMEEKLTTAAGDGTLCDMAMDRLQRAIDSVGLQVEIEDCTLRRKGSLLQGKAENTITKALAELGVVNVNVKIIGDNGVNVNGEYFDFSSADPVDVIATQIQSKLHPESTTPEREKLKETE
jgi:hypothetical protein